MSQSSQQTDQLWGLRDDVAQDLSISRPSFLFDVSLRLSEMARYVDAVNAGLAARFDAPKNFVIGTRG